MPFPQLNYPTFASKFGGPQPGVTQAPTQDPSQAQNTQANPWNNLQTQPEAAQSNPWDMQGPQDFQSIGK